MQKSTQCRKFIQVCPGCKGLFANKLHLENHQNQAQQNGVWCYKASSKSDIVSTLTMSNLQSSTSFFESPQIALASSASKNPAPKPLSIAVEQLRPLSPPTANSLYGIKGKPEDKCFNSSSNIHNFTIGKTETRKHCHSLIRTMTESISADNQVADRRDYCPQPKKRKNNTDMKNPTVDFSNTGYNGPTSKNGFTNKVHIPPEKFSFQKEYICDQNDAILFQHQIEKSIAIQNCTQNSKPKSLRLYDGKVSNGKIYSVMVDNQLDNPLNNEDEDHDFFRQCNTMKHGETLFDDTMIDRDCSQTPSNEYSPSISPRCNSINCKNMPHCTYMSQSFYHYSHHTLIIKIIVLMFLQ